MSLSDENKPKFNYGEVQNSLPVHEIKQMTTEGKLNSYLERISEIVRGDVMKNGRKPNREDILRINEVLNQWRKS